MALVGASAKASASTGRWAGGHAGTGGYAGHGHLWVDRQMTPRPMAASATPKASTGHHAQRRRRQHRYPTAMRVQFHNQHGQWALDNQRACGCGIPPARGSQPCRCLTTTGAQRQHRGFTNHMKDSTMHTDAQLLDLATIELDNVFHLLDGIAPTCSSHAAMLAEAIKALGKAEQLIASVTLA